MVFSAEIMDFRLVHNVLRSISFHEFVIVRPMKEGLKFTLEEVRSTETSAYIPRAMFTSYNINIEDENAEIVFKISMKVFTQCLNIYGDEGNPSLKLTYRGTGAPLKLVIKNNEENITADCEIKTLNLDDFLDVSLAEECGLNKVVVTASTLLEMLQRLDNSAEEITLALNPDPPYFTLITTGVFGESEVNISKQSESITLFQCSKKMTSKYLFSNIRYILKVMAYASKVAISTGESGLLGLQLAITNDDKQMYVEYYTTAQFVGDE